MFVFGKLVDAIDTVVDFLQKFQTDVVVDLVCYRRHGHNEQVSLFQYYSSLISQFICTSKPALKQLYFLVRSLQPSYYPENSIDGCARMIQERRSL